MPFEPGTAAATVAFTQVTGTATAAQVPTAPQVRVAGVAKTSTFIDVQSIVGPANYATGGIPIDLSATYTTILNVTPSRRYVTATKALLPSLALAPNETGTDLYSNAKLRMVLYRGGQVTAAGTNAAPVASGLCIATCNQNHPNLAAVAFTGSAVGPISFTETGATLNDSAQTYEFLVIAQ